MSELSIKEKIEQSYGGKVVDACSLLFGVRTKSLPTEFRELQKKNRRRNFSEGAAAVWVEQLKARYP